MRNFFFGKQHSMLDIVLISTTFYQCGAGSITAWQTLGIVVLGSIILSFVDTIYFGIK
jgi:hypothetical protein